MQSIRGYKANASPTCCGQAPQNRGLSTRPRPLQPAFWLLQMHRVLPGESVRAPLSRVSSSWRSRPSPTHTVHSSEAFSHCAAGSDQESGVSLILRQTATSFRAAWLCQSGLSPQRGRHASNRRHLRLVRGGSRNLTFEAGSMIRKSAKRVYESTIPRIDPRDRAQSRSKARLRFEPIPARARPQ
jgi:hypothetical protein